MKTKFWGTLLSSCGAIAAIGLLTPSAFGQNATKPRTVARLIWQDMDTLEVKWGDVQRVGDEWQLKSQVVAKFPKLDKERQKLVQMQSASGVIICGIRDDDEGTFQSGWVAIRPGVTIEDHGDHTHSHYDEDPTVQLARLDDKQGNPAHLYHYQSQIVIANDALDGFTVVDPSQLDKDPNQAAKFYSGGGNHITIAVHNKKIAYSTWADRDGENKGRVDIVGLTPELNKKLSFQLEHGGLHGATAAGNRVFFAPSEGIASVIVDEAMAQAPTETNIDWISLGKDATSNKAYRTGAFETLGEWVFFHYGAGGQSMLGMLNAGEKKLSLKSVPVPVGDQQTLTTPVPTELRNGKKFAFAFQDNKSASTEEKSVEEKLLVFELDPNSDGDFADAKIAQSIVVGKSRVEGHSGHHDFAILSNKRMAAVSNPGEGSIWILSVLDGKVEAKISVGGAPGKILAY